MLNRIFHRQRPEPLSFKQKLHHFQSLLFSNDEALKLMGNLSELLATGRAFTRREVHPLYSDICENIREATEHLSIMSGGKYRTLVKRASSIKEKCEQILAPVSFCPERWNCDKSDCSGCEKAVEPNADVRYAYHVEEIRTNRSREIGGKMSRLCEVHNNLGIPVPDGFCLTSKCFDDFFSQAELYPKIENVVSSIDFNDNEQIQQASHVIQALIVSSTIPEAIEKVILQSYDQFASGHGEKLVAVRSSAIGEDDPHYSFAGLHYTALNVSRANLVDACFEVLISKYLPQSLVYRYITGLRDVDMPMSIGCQEMIESEVSGVLFTNDPLGGNKDAIIIQAVRGLGTKVVDGSVEAQQYVVDRADNHRVIEFEPGNQDFRAVPRATDGLYDEEIPMSLRRTPCLGDRDIEAIMQYALEIEEYFGSPQDIEWAIDKNKKVYILQCRPLALSETSHAASGPGIQPKRTLVNNPVLIDRGECASHGSGSGEVFVLERFKDLVNFPTGGILVVKRTSPELTSVLHKAAGLIADVGNTTGHLAIIARELSIPVLVNAVDATKRLSNGMEVTIDANACKVYQGTTVDLDSDMHREGTGREIFIKSPMHRIWKEVAQMIIPLNLTDPDSSEFMPENCRTFHDVTRFAHEYSMREMFSIYESAEHEDKQAFPLKFPVPLDVHVIDLGGGLKDIEGRKELTPENIASVPFRSLIEGMTAPGVRWAGPLPIDFKGFTNLLMSNVVDPSRSGMSLGSRSYAIISDCYLNFSSRLGYHFTRLDAYASGEINNNYVNFDFRGGAADPLRRMRRAKVVARILELSNFLVTLENDNVLATIRKIPQFEILRLLSEIGRLMGAVRNADVTFINDENMDEFVNAFLSGDSAPAMKFSERTNE